MDVVDVTRALIAVPSTSGEEQAVLDAIEPLLAQTAPDRLRRNSGGVVAGFGAEDNPIVLSGHLDTVPVGVGWRDSPWSGKVVAGRLYGRGSSDMKGGVAAMIVAADRHRRSSHQCRGVAIALSVEEEIGCHGARRLVNDGLLDAASALIVAEPTANRPLTGHKGALWLRLRTRGKSAHGSRPHDGVNALWLLHAALEQVRGALELLGERHTDLSYNLGTLIGGDQVNIVADSAVAEIDVRTPPGLTSSEVLDVVTSAVGSAAEVEVRLNLAAVDFDDSWLTRAVAGDAPRATASYFTDAGVLAAALNTSVGLILGPGDPTQAHVTDETCEVALLEEAVGLYTHLLDLWCHSEPGPAPTEG